MAKHARHSREAVQKSSETTRGKTTDSPGANRHCVPPLEVREALSLEVSKPIVKVLKEQFENYAEMHWHIWRDRCGRTWSLTESQTEPQEVKTEHEIVSQVRRYCLDHSGEGLPSRDIPDKSKCASPPSDGQPVTCLPKADRLSDVKRSPKKRRSGVNTETAPAKKRRSRIHQPVVTKAEDLEESDNDEDFKGVTFELKPVRIDQVSEAYLDMFKKLQQKGCRQICKAWLRKCHPRKQTDNPYNGGKFGRTEYHPAYDDQGNRGADTAPDYWPSQIGWREGQGCRHREPDHVKKDERLILCLHLLRAGRQFSHSFDIEALQESTMKITADHPVDFQSGAQQLIEQIYAARRKEIKFENGEIDGDTTIYVPMPEQPRSKTKRVIKPRKAPKIKEETPERGGQFDLAGAQQCMSSVDTPTPREEVGEESRNSPESPLKTTQPIGGGDVSRDQRSLEDGLPSAHSSRGSSPSPHPSNDETHASQYESRAASPTDSISTEAVSDRDEPGDEELTQEQNTATPCSFQASSMIHCPTPRRPLSRAMMECTPKYLNDDQFARQYYHDSLPDHKHLSPPYTQDSNRNRQEARFINPAETFFSASAAGSTRLVETYELVPPRPSYSSSGLAGVLPTYGSAMHAPAITMQVPSDASTRIPKTDVNDNRAPAISAYPSLASSDLNGVVPRDPDWLMAEYWCDVFQTGPAAQAYSASLDPNIVGKTAGTPSMGHDGFDQGTGTSDQVNYPLYPSEHQAMAASQRHFSMQSVAATGVSTPAPNSDPQSFAAMDPHGQHLQRQPSGFSYPAFQGHSHHN